MRRFAPVGLALAGLSFALYPAVRPYGPEAGVEGAADFASTAWLVAHVLGMVGFVLLAFSLRALASAPPVWWTGRPVREAETRMWVALSLLLPYYGAEAYGLNALGRYAVDSGQVGVLDVAEGFRMAPFEITTFGLGLLALLLVGVRLAMGAWRSGGPGRAGGLLAGLALATYLPQFFAPAEVRILHGVVLGLGLVLLAVALGSRQAPTDRADAGRGDERQPASA